MTEQPPGPAAPPEPVAPVPTVTPARSKERRDLIVAGALLAAAALAGGGYALFGGGSSGDGRPAARTAAAATPGPTAARAYGVTAGGTHYGDLGELLLPAQPMLKPGPDVERYGNDTVLDAAQAKAMAKGGDGAADLSAKERRQADAELDAMHIKGAALRTFRRVDSSDTYAITIVQVGNKLAAGAAPEAFRKLSQGSDVFAKGPAVPGHPHAVCVVPGSAVAADHDWLQEMYCQATEGDLMVTFRVEGPRVDKGRAVALMAEQLDRVQAPGEGV